MKSALVIALGLAIWAGLWASSLHAEATDQPAGGTDTLSVATWGGAYAEAQKRAVFDPFQSEKNITIDALSHDGQLATLRRELEGSAKWDVVDLNMEATNALCRDGALEPIDPAKLAAASNGSDVAADFLPGGLLPCGIASMAWSATLVFDGRAFDKAKPAQASDLFDLTRFPGKRTLPKGPRYTFEIALLADGVPPADVYAQLRTEDGVNRALKALDRIKASTVWWEDAAEPLEKLASREVTMGLAYTGRTFRTAVTGSLPLGLIWNAQIYDLDFWAIPKTARNKDAALSFIAFATQPERLADQARLLPYGPMRKSAVALVDKHADLDVDVKRFLPTAENRFDQALAFDGAFWSEREAELTQRFEGWLSGPPVETSAVSPAPESPPAPPAAAESTPPPPAPPVAEAKPEAPAPPAAAEKPAAEAPVVAEKTPAAEPPAPPEPVPAPPPVAAAPPIPAPAPRTPPAPAPSQATVTPEPAAPPTEQPRRRAAPPDPAMPPGRYPSGAPSAAPASPDKSAEAETPPPPERRPKKRVRPVPRKLDAERRSNSRWSM